MSPETHDPELASLAKALAALAPSAGQLDRDQVLFRAGQASVGRWGWWGWVWPSVAAVLALVAAAVCLSTVLRPAPQQVQCVIYRRVMPPVSPAELVANKQAAPQDTTTPTSEEIGPQETPLSYLRLQRLVFAWGVDALPNPPVAAASRGHNRLLNAQPDLWSRNRWLQMQTP